MQGPSSFSQMKKISLILHEYAKKNVFIVANPLRMKISRPHKHYIIEKHPVDFARSSFLGQIIARNATIKMK